MTMKRILCACLAAVVLTTGVCAAFTDVRDWDWYAYYVNQLAADDIISGMTDTTFLPNGTLTWGQALKLTARAVGEPELPHVEGLHWAAGYLVMARERGWQDADVDPDAPVSRLEFCQVAAKAAGLTAQPEQNPFADCADGHVLALVHMGIINGMTETEFAPDATLTRAQIAKIIWGLRHVLATGEHTSTAQVPPPAQKPADVPVSSVNISETLDMLPGQTKKLPVVIAPADAADKSIVWTAGNPGVATVDENGQITAIRPGQCHITATAKSGKKSTCLVTVQEIPLKNLTLSAEMTLEVGQSRKLTVLYTPANTTQKNFVWTAGNPAVATVDENGKVTAHRAGQCHISVSAGGKKSTCLVTVPEPVTPADFAGRWMDAVSQRASMEVVYDAAKDVFSVTVQWANSAFETILWRMEGKLEGKVLVCHERKQFSVTEDGESLISTGTARLEMDSGSIFWHDSAEGSTVDVSQCRFVKLFGT